MRIPKVTRVQRHDLPNRWVKCSSVMCVYNVEGGFCDTPQINKGNGDAACHRESNRALLSRLQECSTPSSPGDQT